MKTKLLLLLLLFLLTGCVNRPIAPSRPPQTLYRPESPIEVQTGGAVRAYGLHLPQVYGLRAMGSRVLLLSGADETTLTVLSGAEGTVEAAASLGFYLASDDPSLGVQEEGLSYFDPLNRETVVLDQALEPLRQIAAPADLSGSPILSGDGRTLFYSTPTGLRAWDLDNGIRRVITGQLSYPIVGLHWQDTVLQLRAAEGSILLDARDGRQLFQWDGAMTLHTRDEQYYAALDQGQQQLLLFGQEADAPALLTPPSLQRGLFLRFRPGAVTVRGNTLSCFDLSTGRCTGTLKLDTPPLDVADTRDGWVYVLTEDGLYRWDVEALPSEDAQCYVSSYGDTDLTQCRLLARDIEGRYGIRVLVGQDAADRQPWDYTFTPEPLAAPTYRQLELLDESLSHFPRQVLDAIFDPYESGTICLVREISGTSGSGGVSAANGLQFFTGDDVTLALAIGPQSDRSLYHELLHVLEPRLVAESAAIQNWDSLNPQGFRYNHSYTAAQSPQAQALVEGDDPAFLDRYSMRYPKEDRARILEYAMTQGNEAVFRSPTLQAKLKALCTGIRQVCDLEASPETFLWEQYLTLE